MHYLSQSALPVVTPKHLLSEADRCVKCGLCLPECPTYGLLASEADSPRGRISLIQALARDELDLNSHIEIHLNRCLGCLACEAACPSGVRYGQLLDASREIIAKHHHGKPLIRKMFNQLTDASRLNFWRRLYHAMDRIGFVALSEKLPISRLRRLLSFAQQLGPAPRIKPGLYPSSQPTGRLLQLFTGCVGSQVEQQLIQTSMQLLSRLGYAVEIPESQSCCGAIHRHNGFTDEAERLCDTNRLQTSKSRAQKLITIASACHLELTEQKASHIPLMSITDFLLTLPKGEFPTLAPLKKTALLHIPCSARHDRNLELLAKIPSLKLAELPENNICCGAAGSYLLTQPELSQRLGRAKINHLKSSQAELLITSNTGCAMQFRQLIKESSLSIEVVHPIELIFRQWNDRSKQKIQ
ncbi:MAG: (Fe-S)-binding protein [Candidatus Thiodiazotropha sp.]|jgi:glycolate oxidase iron-sulfur subunit